MNRIMDGYIEFKTMYFMNEEQKHVDIDYDKINDHFVNVINKREERKFLKGVK